MTKPVHGRADITLASIWIAIIIGIGLGMLRSLAVVYHVWGADSDIADPVLIWQGVHRYGIRFIAIWRYTQDNWLLSLMPFDALVFTLFGDRPGVVVFTGLLFFWAMCVLVGVLIARERGAPTGAIATIVLLCAGVPSIANFGFLGYAVSHGISLVWGLAGVLLTSLWLDRRRLKFLVAAGICLFVGAVSDPWADAAFLMPMALASLILATLGRERMRGVFSRILGMVLVVGVLVQTKLLGVLGFLPGVEHSRATISQMIANAAFAARYVAVFFNVLPGSLTRTAAMPGTLVVAVDCVGFVALVALCIIRLRQGFATMTARRRYLALTSLVSIGVMPVALILTGFQQGMVTARYFANFFAFIPILMAATLAGRTHFAGPDRAVAALLAGLFMLSGLVGNRAPWSDPMPATNLNGMPQLATVLNAQGVRFGYGPYWWTEANAMRWVTHGAVTLRPMVFDPLSRRFGPKTIQTLADWYKTAAINRAPPRMALILPPSGSCGAANCEQAAEAQFGKPTKILPYGPLLILIYDHRLYLAAD